MTLKPKIGFVVGFIAISLITITGGSTDRKQKREHDIEAEVSKYDYIFNTIGEKSYRTFLRDTLYSALWNLEECTDKHTKCDKKVYDLNEKLRIKSEELLVAQKRIGALELNLTTTCRILEKRSVSMRAMIIRTCEEYTEEGVFPNWLQAFPISRKEKWILAIACLESPFAEAIRKIIKEIYSDFEVGVATVARGMDSIYDDISQRFSIPIALEDIDIPTNESEIEEICKTATLKNDMETQLVCELIFKFRNVVAAKISLLEGQGQKKSDEAKDAIFYGIIRRNDGKSFGLVKDALDKVSNNFDGCKIKSNRFWNKITKRDRNGPTTEAVITFKATCPKTIVFTDFRDHTREQLKGFLSNDTAESDLYIVEDPINPGKQTAPSVYELNIVDQP